MVRESTFSIHFSKKKVLLCDRKRCTTYSASCLWHVLSSGAGGRGVGGGERRTEGRQRGVGGEERGYSVLGPNWGTSPPLPWPGPDWGTPLPFPTRTWLGYPSPPLPLPTPPPWPRPDWGIPSLPGKGPETRDCDTPLLHCQWTNWKHYLPS